MILKTCDDAGCDIIGLQEVRRNGQIAFTAAGYVVLCSAADGGKYEKKGKHGVALAVRESIVAGMVKGDVAVECIGARLMKVRIQNSKGNLTVCLSLQAMLPLSTRAPAKMITFGVHLTRWSRGYPVGTISLS